MFCPQCGTESTSGQQYCRSCGANLKVIGKAVTLSEAIARSDRGPLPKIKEMMKNLKMEQVSDDISNALDKMNQEIVRTSGSLAPAKMTFEQSVEKHFGKTQQRGKKGKTAAQRRESHIVHGLISLFSGAGSMIFLYYLSSVLVLKLPERILAEAPFEIDPVVKIIWLVGLIPALTGLGRILAGLTIRPDPPPVVEFPHESASPHRLESPDTNELAARYEPGSVTDRTTNILNRQA